MKNQNRLDQNMARQNVYRIVSVAAVVIIAIRSAVQFKLGEEK